MSSSVGVSKDTAERLEVLSKNLKVSKTLLVEYALRIATEGLHPDHLFTNIIRLYGSQSLRRKK